MPASLSLLTATFAEGEQRNRAIGVYGAMAVLGIVATVVAATTLADGSGRTETLVGGLRWGTLACVGFAIAALPVVLFGLLGEVDREPGRRGFDH